jgi:hypothetical protein
MQAGIHAMMGIFLFGWDFERLSMKWWLSQILFRWFCLFGYIFLWLQAHRPVFSWDMRNGLRLCGLAAYHFLRQEAFLRKCFCFLTRPKNYSRRWQTYQDYESFCTFQYAPSLEPVFRTHMSKWVPATPESTSSIRRVHCSKDFTARRIFKSAICL